MDNIPPHIGQIISPHPLRLFTCLKAEVGKVQGLRGVFCSEWSNSFSWRRCIRNVPPEAPAAQKAEQSGATGVETGRKCPWSGYNFQQCGRFHTDLSVLATPDEQSVDSLAVVGARLRRQMDIGLDEAAAAGRRKSGER